MNTILVTSPFKVEYKGKRVFFTPSSLMLEVDDDFVELDIVKRCCKIISRNENTKSNIEVIENSEYDDNVETDFTSDDVSILNGESRRGRRKKIVE